MFGEMVGAALADCWRRAGAPGDAIYAELGPGRGTLAADALRVLRQAGFAGDVHLVETSPTLRAAQRERVPGAIFHDRIGDLPARPLLLAANEFLDALPVRQWIGDEERRVVSQGGELAFLSNGLVREDSPARDAAVEALARHIAAHGGVALLIDYGHARTAPGDTLQAIRGHAFADPLKNPGEHDLTAHVDFEAVARRVQSAGAAVTSLATQGGWLSRLGIHARGNALARHNPDRADDIAAAINRLTDPGAMGDLFKVMAIHAPGWPIPAGFAG
jgi:SAM-dependent MidA family methyltransferase